MIDHSDFADGFREGYRLIAGNNAGMPGIPGRPGIPANKTAWQMGFIAGLERAGVKVPT